MNTSPEHLLKSTLQVDKITCASCVKRIEDRLCELPGVIDSSVNFASGKVVVTYDSRRMNSEQMIRALTDLGYPARLASFQQNKKVDWLFWQTLLACILAIPFLLHMLGVPLSLKLQLFLATIIQLGAGFPFYVGTWYGLRTLTANMDTLVALGTTAAYGLSLWNIIADKEGHLYFETSVFLIFFILLGRCLEKWARQRAGAGIESLLKLQPKVATIKKGTEQIDIPIEQVTLSTTVLVKPGEKVPVDGTVLAGSSFVDESFLTGESLPIPKQKGDTLFAGTLNKEGLLEIKATSIGEATVLGHIIRLVEEAQSSKAPIQRLADRVTAYFVPAVLLVALATWLIGGVVTHNFSQALINAVSVLVIACPCALGLATPTAIMVACGRGASQGILIKDAAALEKAKQINLVIFDKTGTVTEGKLAVTYQAISHQADSSLFEQVSAGLVRYSDHPASQAIGVFLSQAVKPLYIEDYTAYPGKGVGGKAEGKQYYLGSISFIRDLKIDTAEFDSQWKAETAMIVAVSDANQCLGYFLLADQLKPEAKNVVKQIHEQGIETLLLSGDRKSATKRIADELKVDGFEAEVLPDRKAAVVEKYKSVNRTVAMVGDGVNDAPALAAADVGFALGGGTDVAIESASIILATSDLKGVLDSIQLARQTYKKIRQNLFFAFGYNMLGIPLAALGLLHPLIAGIAMALSSLSVVTNSLLLYRRSLRH
jgi:Cu+-exporting ATPase